MNPQKNPLVGKKAPQFKLHDSNGKLVDLNKIKEDYLVLFFYPKDDTSGCTLEAQGFSKLKSQFTKKNTRIFGISGGDAAAKQKFCKKYGLKVELLADPEFKVATRYKSYGEKSFMGRKYKGIFRNTFVLDRSRKVIHALEKVDPKSHPAEVLKLIADSKTPKVDNAKKVAAKIPAVRRTRAKSASKF